MKRHLRKWVEAHVAHHEAEIERLIDRCDDLFQRVAKAEGRAIPLMSDLRSCLKQGKRLEIRTISNGTLGEVFRCELIDGQGGRRAIDRATDDLGLRTRIGIDLEAVQLERALRILFADALKGGKPC